jgi:2-methylcitrate dehydratase
MDQQVDAWLSRISDFAFTFHYDDMPQAVLQAAHERLIDALGCALGSSALPSGCPPANAGRRVASLAARAEHEGRVIGTQDVLSAEAATFINGCLIRYLDFNDTWPGHHPSDALAALFAVAPAVRANGRELLSAMVVSYEISIRLTKSGRLNKRGWDNGYATGLGAAAAVARLMGLSLEQMRQAIAIIATANIPMRATRSGQLSMWKGAATAFSVAEAVHAAQLAAAGMTGPEAPFTGRHGLMDLITGPIELDAFPTEGGDYLLQTVKLKYWPLVHNLQSLVWAGIELRERLGDRVPASIHVLTCAPAWRESGSEPAKWDPRTRETADHSAPYILAWVLRHGTIGEEAFEPTALLDPSLRPEMERITIAVDEEIDRVYPDTIRTRLLATDTAGGTYEVEITDPLGHEKNPMRPADIDAKFRRLAASLLDAEQLDEALRTWWRCEDFHAAEALDLLVSAPERILVR